MIKKIFTLFILLFSFASQAQEAATGGPQMADSFRADGKIYVVISVLAIIFISIIVFLISLERKLKKLENEIKEKNTAHS